MVTINWCGSPEPTRLIRHPLPPHHCPTPHPPTGFEAGWDLPTPGPCRDVQCHHAYLDRNRCVDGGGRKCGVIGGSIGLGAVCGLHHPHRNGRYLPSPHHTFLTLIGAICIVITHNRGFLTPPSLQTGNSGFTMVAASPLLYPGNGPQIQGTMTAYLQSFPAGQVRFGGRLSAQGRGAEW